MPFFIERLRTLFMPQVLEDRTTLFQGTGFSSCSATLPVIGILLAILYCWKNQGNWITALVLIALMSFLTPLNSAFSLFTSPGYTRWAYALTLFLILASVKWMDNCRQEKQESPLRHGRYMELWLYVPLRSPCLVERAWKRQ